MIKLVCTKCSTVLNVDDGFAGGVCRCSACGTIQTVPRKNAAAAGESGKATVIYERATRDAVSKDLEALGEVVTSSGIAGSGVLYQSARHKARPALSAWWKGALLGAAVALAAALGVYLLVSRTNSSTSAATPAEPATPKATTAAPAAGARFGPIALDRAGTVIYLVDRGDATRPFTASISSAVVHSLATLAPTRRFQVRYWWSNGESPAYPLTPAEPSEFNRGKAAAWMNDVPGGQSTDALASLDAALAARPTEIVLITGKAWQMDETFTGAAVARLAGSPVRVHVVSLGTHLDEDPLARLASKTGGTFLPLTEEEIALLAQPNQKN